MKYLTMKEQLAEDAAPPSSLKDALTQKQIDKPSCRWFHKWQTIKEYNSAYTHMQCKKCFDRVAVGRIFTGYSAPNHYWLKGKAWEYSPIIDVQSQIPAAWLPKQKSLKENANV